MEHAAHSVDILDKNGHVVKKKLRRDVDKLHDIYHSVHVLLITPRGELVLSSIPAREDLPNLYSKRLGTTVATIRRSDETAKQAAVRALARELFIEDANVELVGEKMVQLPEHRNLVTAYYLVADPPSIYSVIDIASLAVVTTHQFRNMLDNYLDDIAPALKMIWEEYSEKLPI